MRLLLLRFITDAATLVVYEAATNAASVPIQGPIKTTDTAYPLYLRRVRRALQPIVLPVNIQT